MARILPFFPLSHALPRVDDRRVVSGIVYVIRNRFRWKDAPAGYGPHKTLQPGVFDRIFAGLAGEGPGFCGPLGCTAVHSRDTAISSSAEFAKW